MFPDYFFSCFEVIGEAFLCISFSGEYSSISLDVF